MVKGLPFLLVVLVVQGLHLFPASPELEGKRYDEGSWQFKVMCGCLTASPGAPVKPGAPSAPGGP